MARPWIENATGMDELLSSPTGPVVQLVARVTRDVLRTVEVECPKRTGDTSRSFRSDITIRPGRQVRGRVYSDDPVVGYLEKGTGLFGPRARRIVPRRAKALRFEVGGQVVFARSVKGMRPKPFMRRSLEIASPWPVRDGA
ncbi:hypothetical protein [Streptomyces sp. NPDC088739]|uniref:hypothetical protein n=1 Tax=Streptomyces sp. NPDC088739 TaxID=3365882 RepID=UPI00381BBD67